MRSCVLIITSAQRDDANTLAQLMGWGPDNYSVALSADGEAPATHYGLHAWTTPAFEAMLAAAEEGTMPPELEEAGYPAVTFSAVMEALTASFRDSYAEHFQGGVAGMGLSGGTNQIPNDA